jgi:hypothetical protein
MEKKRREDFEREGERVCEGVSKCGILREVVWAFGLLGVGEDSLGRVAFERCGVCGAPGDCAGGFTCAACLKRAGAGLLGVVPSGCSERMRAHFSEESETVPGLVCVMPRR